MIQEPSKVCTSRLPDRKAVFRSKRKYWYLKRTQDVCLSLIALLLLWPVMLVTAVAILLESPDASPIFVQTRVGKDGKEFQLYKFRSMYPDAEERLNELLSYNEMDGPAFKIRNDPRITRVGHFIRRTSIDELPQLFNILKGEMSIVGPRPALPREVERYDDFARKRLEAVPGLTCYWQIQPYSKRIRFDQWMDLDMRYISDCSFLTDWKIILATVGVVLGMDRE